MHHRGCISLWTLFVYLGKCSFLIYKNAPRGCTLRRTRKMSHALKCAKAYSLIYQEISCICNMASWNVNKVLVGEHGNI